jgi:hypothetical protein
MRILILLFATFAAWGQKTDLNPYAVPSPPALPGRLQKFTDATFGSTIMQVTDSTDGSTCWHDYSYWQTFSSDMTRFILKCHDGGENTDYYHVYTLDPTGPTTFTATKGANLGWQWIEGLAFSATEPKILYGIGYGNAGGYANRLVRIDVTNAASPTYTVIKDFTATVTNIWQPFFDSAADRWAFKTQSGTTVYVWDRSADQILLQKSYTGLDEAQIDKSGRYVVVKNSTSNWIVDLNNGNSETYLATRLHPDHSFGHSDNASGWVAAGMNDYDEERGILRRTFGSIADTSTTIWCPGSDWYLNDWHVSARTIDDLWVAGSTLRTDGGYATAATAGQAALRNEIFLAKADGSHEFLRVAHHQSCYDGTNYWTTPRAVVSPDAGYVMWTSNWSRVGTGRTDVFIAATGLSEETPADPPATPRPSLSGATSISGAASIQ